MDSAIRRRFSVSAGFVAAVLLGASPCASHAAAPSRAAADCAKLQGVAIPAAQISLPTSGAAVKDAKLVPAAPETHEQPTAFNPSGLTLAKPEFCKVTGAIAPVDPSAPPINFELNLPTQWNGKAVHMGGGGFDGNVVTGLNALPRSPDTLALPITRGFATFGSDSGHTGNDATFAVSKEALQNFSGDQLQKTHDVALALIKARYGKAPAKLYFTGQSEGGREGLTVAQRWPEEYDGVAVTAPAMNFTKMLFHFADVSTAISRPGGYLNAAKVKTLADAILDQCDMNDGIKDGIVGNYLGCRFDPSVLRCPRGLDTGDSCLSDQQLATVAVLYRPTIWRGADGKPIVELPRYLVGGNEGSPGALQAWIFGKNPMPRQIPVGKDLTQQKVGTGTAPYYATMGLRYLIANNPAFDPYDFDPVPYAAQVKDAVKLLASDDPNIGAFMKRGGKLIMLHNTSDATVTPVQTMAYYDSVVATLGREQTNSFARLYIVPGGDHGGGGPVPSKVDLLGMLDQWVAGGKAPQDDWTAEEDGPDGKPIRTKPLCAYPYYPRYSGSGDANLATSFRCVASRP